MVRAWITDCVRDHPECQVSSKKSFPSRLLDVGAFDQQLLQCFLVDAVASMVEYVTLSYCWGESQPLLTTKVNLGAHKQGILISNMPTTLQQAVQISRALGYRYLWIDALCIVQDDPLEWKREALEMGNIHQQSICTIAATGSKSAEGGLFLPRTDAQGAIAVAIPFVSEHGVEPQRYFSVQRARKGFSDLVQSSKWNSRGWILQERLLSRRVLHFADGQTFFECQRYSTGEDKVDISHYSHKRRGNESSGISKDWSWCLLVEDYTKRQLTQPSDKIYALAGLATDMAKINGKKYCAGVWTEMLNLHLLWYGVSGPVTKPPTTRAPSWS
jgi:hypothetical protein